MGLHRHGCGKVEMPQGLWDFQAEGKSGWYISPPRLFHSLFRRRFPPRIPLGAKRCNTMRKSRGNSKIFPKSEWATTIYELRQRLNLSQDAFGHLLHSSAMCRSRWSPHHHRKSMQQLALAERGARLPLICDWGSTD